jgi:hypothetical protein
MILTVNPKDLNDMEVDYFLEWAKINLKDLNFDFKHLFLILLNEKLNRNEIE